MPFSETVGRIVVVTGQKLRGNLLFPALYGLAYLSMPLKSDRST
ncbi:hypothetical protein HMPREF0080_02149 [Anaeroglobus geminatus F0357]|uniref:Uncharacterized protein n=1 Tax=Anaeroglobus geminatus F0357 TaxID=861450 RepID=G9YKD9_9FIRM|nr:hypothetical protein HMPREF0080_02149 [Anaeroglobus geminatus F0357]